MRNPIYFLQRNVGLFPLASAAIGGAIGFGIGSTGRIAVDSINFLYDTALYAVKNFPYSFQINSSQIVSTVVAAAEGSVEHAVYDGLEAGAVYSAGSLLLAKKISGIFSSKDRR